MNANDTRTYGTSIISCNCIDSKYLNHHHGCIITGDLNIIENKNYQKISSKDYNLEKQFKKYRGRLTQSD